MSILSVIIPTHNRQRYALNAITAILENFPNTEVVVSDTSDSRELEQKLFHWIETGRLIYDHPNEAYDVVANFENGLTLATGEYLIFLGDDDCLGPDAERIAYWAQGEGLDAVACSLNATYGWPDFISKYFKDGYSAKLAINPYDGLIEPSDCLVELKACLDNLGAGVLKMPRAYLGMISRNLVSRIQMKYGRLFGGVSPDIYSAALISVECSKFVRLNYPFILPGSSGASTSGQSASGAHRGALRNNDHIGAFKSLIWDELIPEFYSVPTVWSYSLLKALEKIGSSDLLPNYPRLYIKCLLYHSSYFTETLASIRFCMSKFGVLKITRLLIIEFFRECVMQGKRIARRVRNPKATADACVIANLMCISDAYRALAEYTSNNNKKLNLISK